jgi:hypothetical protein
MKDKSKLRSVPKCMHSGHQPQQTMAAEEWGCVQQRRGIVWTDKLWGEEVERVVGLGRL